MDVKVLRETDASGLQRWEPILKAPFPLDDEAAPDGLPGPPPPASGRPARGPDPGGGPGGGGAGAPGGPRLLRVRKRRARYTVAGCQAERAVFEVEGRRTTSIAVESTDPAAVVAAVDALGLQRLRQPGRPDGAAGCSSTRCRSATPSSTRARTRSSSTSRSSTADGAPGGRSSTGPWSTRLGEGLEATGEIGAEPLERTARRSARWPRRPAARRPGHRRGGHGRAADGSQPGRGRRDGSGARSGLTLEVISGEEEGRLAYLAVATGVGLGDGAIVVFDTGGGSSQFTFGHGAEVDERFSVDVGAVRFTERFGLAQAVSADVVAEAVAAIAAELGRLDGRPAPGRRVVAMGGAVTNLAAVKHGLTTYDPDVVQGTVLDRAEIDRQIELLPRPGRRRAAADRRAAAGRVPR